MLMTVSRGAEPRNKFYYCDLTKLDGGKIQGTITFETLSAKLDYLAETLSLQYTSSKFNMLCVHLICLSAHSKSTYRTSV